MHYVRGALVFSLLILTAGPVGGLNWGRPLLGQDHPKEKLPVKVREVEGITEYHLENGTKLLLFPDISQPTVTVNMTVLVGSRHEGYGEAGMAHLLEHMLFKGTPTHPNIPKVLQDRGAQFNGTTWVDRTNYYETLPATDDNLEFAIRLEADRLVNSFVRGEDLQSEMTVVRNEFERGENSPSRVLMQRIQGAAYEWHNYGKSTIGNRSDIERVPITNLRDFYRRHYQPDNVVLIIGGKFEPEKALALVSKYFGALPRPERDKNTTYTEEPPQDGERTVALRRVGEVAIVGVAYHIPAAAHPDFAAVNMLHVILGMEPSGRLYKALKEPNLASAVSAYAFPHHDPGLLMADAEFSDESKIEEVRQLLLKTIEEIGATGVTDDELNRARDELVKQREDINSNITRFVRELSEWSARGDWRLFFLHRDRIEKVTAEDVKRVAAQYLRRNNRTVGLFIPTKEAERVAVASTPDVEQMVKDYRGREALAQAEAFDPTPENIDRRTIRATLPSGLKLAMLPKGTRGNVVQLRLALRYGNEGSLNGMQTAAELMPYLMTRGVKNMDITQLTDELTKYRADLSGSGMRGLATFSVKTKREHLLPVLDILRQVLREPTFPASELELYRRQMLDSMESQLVEPQALAGNQLGRTLAPHDPDDIRYRPTLKEQMDRISEVKLDQIKQLYREFLGSEHAELAIVGDFDPEEVKQALTELTKDWKSEKSFARIDDDANAKVPGGSSEIVTPDKANAVYLAGMRFRMRDDHPDFPALTIGNFILGGGSLSSRLGDRVRQQEGLSYGVGSMLRSHPIDENTQFMVFAITNPQNRDRLVKVIQEELKKIVEVGITQEELERAKKGYLESLKVGRTTDPGLLGLLSDGLFTDRTMEFHAAREAMIAKLTVEQVNQVLRKYLDLKRLYVVTAGDFRAAPAKDGEAKKETEAKSGS